MLITYSYCMLELKSMKKNAKYEINIVKVVLVNTVWKTCFATLQK